MKVVIMAGGKGTRISLVASDIPKPMIKIFGKPILEHNLEHIYSKVDEIIIVTKYKEEIIKDYFKDNFK